VEKKSLNNPKKSKVHEFPRVIKDLPEADIQIPSIKAWILQGEKQQLVFFEMEPIAKVPEHSHLYPQWGIVVEGEMNLTVNGEAKLYEKGEDYLIPAQMKHSATFPTKARVIDLFQEKARYRPKQTRSM
jgi:quercetin dioxygenase-like cupin family protein